MLFQELLANALQRITNPTMVRRNAIPICGGAQRNKICVDVDGNMKCPFCRRNFAEFAMLLDHLDKSRTNPQPLTLDHHPNGANMNILRLVDELRHRRAYAIHGGRGDDFESCISFQGNVTFKCPCCNWVFRNNHLLNHLLESRINRAAGLYVNIDPQNPMQLITPVQTFVQRDAPAVNRNRPVNANQILVAEFDNAVQFQQAVAEQPRSPMANAAEFLDQPVLNDLLQVVQEDLNNQPMPNFQFGFVNNNFGGRE